MTKGITDLVNLLNRGNDRREMLSPKEFVMALREGMKTEPEKFAQLVKAFEARIRRAYPTWSSDSAKQRTLGNIAGYALMADHDYETEMMARAATGGPKNVAEWYDNPQEYGVAMTAFASYVGVQGPSLREHVLDLC